MIVINHQKLGENHLQTNPNVCMHQHCHPVETHQVLVFFWMMWNLLFDEHFNVVGNQQNMVGNIEVLVP